MQILHKNICISAYVVYKKLLSLKYTKHILGRMIVIRTMFENRVLGRKPGLKKEKQTRNRELYRERIYWN
jgi:hypothetical protein